jgi:hypothetical protein
METPATTQPGNTGSTGPVEPSEGAARVNKLTIDATLTLPTSYMFRGYVLVNGGFQAQPELTIGYDYQLPSFTLHPFATVWANLAESQHGPHDPRWFNELDGYAGVKAAGLPGGFDVTLEYLLYTSPADAFGDQHEVGLVVQHDDPITPHVALYYMFINRDDGGNHPVYLELGIDPTWDKPIPSLPALSLDFPVNVGLNLGGQQYTTADGSDQFLGYVSAGVTATYGLNDNWSVFAGGDAFLASAFSVRHTYGGSDFHAAGRVGVTFSY